VELLTFVLGAGATDPAVQPQWRPREKDSPDQKDRRYQVCALRNLNSHFGRRDHPCVESASDRFTGFTIPRGSPRTLSSHSSGVLQLPSWGVNRRGCIGIIRAILPLETPMAHTDGVNEHVPHNQR
jgi:hypothetical protein